MPIPNALFSLTVPTTVIRRLFLLLALLCPTLPTLPTQAAPATDGPVDIIAAQFGIFDASTPGELSFEATNLIPRITGQRYGWIIEVKTTKRHISVREEYAFALPDKKNTPEEKDEFLDSFRQPPQRRNQVSERQLTPVEGQIYGEWFIGQNEPAGHRRLLVYVEGKLAATFEYDVK